MAQFPKRITIEAPVKEFTSKELTTLREAKLDLVQNKFESAGERLKALIKDDTLTHRNVFLQTLLLKKEYHCGRFVLAL